MGKGRIVLPCLWWKFLGRFLPARDRCGGWGTGGSVPIAECLHLPAQLPCGAERLELSLGLCSQVPGTQALTASSLAKDQPS